MKRYNQGYEIINSRMDGEREIVLARKETKFGLMYATWERTPENDRAGEENFYWGHYFSNDEKAANVDFWSR